jgi:hypothetical protein
MYHRRLSNRRQSRDQPDCSMRITAYSTELIQRNSVSGKTRSCPPQMTLSEDLSSSNTSQAIARVASRHCSYCHNFAGPHGGGRGGTNDRRHHSSVPDSLLTIMTFCDCDLTIGQLNTCSTNCSKVKQKQICNCIASRISTVVQGNNYKLYVHFVDIV